MTDLPEIGDLLKMFEATIGKKPTRIIIWIIAIGVLLLVVNLIIEQINKLVNTFGGTISWAALLYMAIATILALLMFGGFALALALLLHIGIDRLQRNRTYVLIDKLISILTKAQQQPDGISKQDINAVLDETIKLKRSSLWTRILTRIKK